MKTVTNKETTNFSGLQNKPPNIYFRRAKWVLNSKPTEQGEAINYCKIRLSGLSPPLTIRLCKITVSALASGPSRAEAPITLPRSKFENICQSLTPELTLCHNIQFYILHIFQRPKTQAFFGKHDTILKVCI